MFMLRNSKIIIDKRIHGRVRDIKTISSRVRTLTLSNGTLHTHKRTYGRVRRVDAINIRIRTLMLFNGSIVYYCIYTRVREISNRIIPPTVCYLTSTLMLTKAFNLPPRKNIYTI